MRRFVVVVSLGCVAGLLLLGAAGQFPQETGPESTPPATSTPEPGTYPPGVDVSGVQNASRLLAAHHQSLLDSGYVVATKYTYRTDDTARNFTHERRIVATPGLETLLVQRSRRDQTVGRSVIELWANETTAVGRFDEAGDEPTVRPVRRIDDVSRNTGTTEIGRVLAAGEFELVAVTTDEDRTLYTLRATGVRPEAATDRPAERRSLSAQVVVTGSGQIRSMSASLTSVTVENGDRHVTLEVFVYRVTRTGVETVPTPDWVGEAATDDQNEGSP